MHARTHAQMRARTHTHTHTHTHRHTHINTNTHMYTPRHRHMHSRTRSPSPNPQLHTHTQHKQVHRSMWPKTCMLPCPFTVHSLSALMQSPHTALPLLRSVGCTLWPKEVVLHVYVPSCLGLGGCMSYVPGTPHHLTFG